MKYTPAIIISLVLIKLYQIGTVPDPIVYTQTVDAGDWRTVFALDLLHQLNNDQPTVETVAFIIAWTIAEDGSDGAFLRNNPLNTSQDGFDNTGSINGDGVKGYSTYEDGLDATVQTLTGYPHILYGLQTNNLEYMLNDEELRTWGTGLNAILNVMSRQ